MGVLTITSVVYDKRDATFRKIFDRKFEQCDEGNERLNLGSMIQVYARNLIKCIFLNLRVFLKMSKCDNFGWEQYFLIPKIVPGTADILLY